MLPLLFMFLSLLGIFCPAAAIVQAASLVSSFPSNGSGLLFTPPLPANHTDNALALTTLDHQPDSETIAAYSQVGLCMSYLGRLLPDYHEDWNRNKSLVSCQNWCTKDVASDGYGCIGPNITQLSQLDPSLIYQDDDGLHYTPGKCNCELELAEAIVDIIAEGLQELSSVLCAVFASIFSEVLEVGVMFLPGAELADAADMIVTTVKTFDQNALSPLDYVNKYLGSKCGVTGISLDPFSLFAILAGASNGVGTSRGCYRRNAIGCVQPKDNPDPAPDVPRSPEKDPWEGETPPSTDVPAYCDNTPRLLRTRGGKSKCKAIPDVEAQGYTYEDKSTSGQYQPGTWSIQCPDKWTKGVLNDVAILRLNPEYGMMTVEYAYLDMIDTIKKLKLRDMMAGLWKAKTNYGVEYIQQVVHQSVVEKGWIGRGGGDRGTQGKVLDLLGKKVGDEYTVRVASSGNEKQAFNVMLKETTQGAGVFKMLETYAGGMGRQITQFDVRRVGGQDCIYISIGPGATA